MSKYTHSIANKSQVIIVNKDHITVGYLLQGSGYNGMRTRDGPYNLLTSAIYSKRIRRGSGYFEASTKVDKDGRVTYVGLRRVAYVFKLHVRFRFRFVHVGSRSCRSNPWPNIQDAGNAISLNKNALVEYLVLGRF
jgi:hypothetical protein